MADADRANVPEHVPTELVFPFTISHGGPKSDPFDVLIPEMQAQRPDVFFAPGAHMTGAGAWVPKRCELVRYVMNDPITFSSYKQAGFSQALGEDWPLIPSESGPSDHAEFRQLLLPLFTPAKMSQLEGMIADAANSLIDRFEDRGECDFAAEFSSQLPPKVFLHLMGLSMDEMGEFVPLVGQLLHTTDTEKRFHAGQTIKKFLTEQIQDRRRKPSNDFISYCAHARFKTRTLEEWEIISLVYQLYLGGLDTVSMSLGWYFKHLAENQQNQALLRANPDRIPEALEELIRAFPIVTTSRQATKDTEIGGVPIRAGDYVMCSTPLVSRDENEYERPNVVDFSRKDVISMTFAYGPHRCIGSHLARRELGIALRTVLERTPVFRRKDKSPLPFHLGSLIGLDALPLVWENA